LRVLTAFLVLDGEFDEIMNGDVVLVVVFAEERELGSDERQVSG
jgi:hypothetical protein